MVVNRALLIVDIQACHFPEGGMPHRAQEVLGINRWLIERARGRGVPVIFVQHCAGPGTDYEPDTAGWQVHPLLEPRDGEARVLKRHPDSFQGTELEGLLRSRGIGKLVVAGMQSEMCVDTTVRRAYSLGFEVELIADGHTTWSSEAAPAEVIVAHHNHVLGRRFARAVQHDQADL